jgi:serine/threonine-protein kinase
MEYVPGMSLGQRFRSQGTFPAVELIDYAAQAALGLGHAHSQGVVHRDVKPSNLLLTDDGLVKVLDLGLGVLMESDTHSTFATQDGIAVGTIDYMSPEQARGGDVDGRSDIYSLGCAMYHLISGRLPFPAESPIERLGRRINNQPEPLASFVRSLPPKFPEVLDRMLANRPEDRYQSADETASALWSTLPDGKKRKRRHAFSVTDSSVEAAPPQPQVIERKVEVEVEVMPNFPGWFQPVADFVLTSPNGGLATVIGLLLLTFAAGLLAGWLLLPRS